MSNRKSNNITNKTGLEWTEIKTQYETLQKQNKLTEGKQQN